MTQIIHFVTCNVVFELFFTPDAMLGNNVKEECADENQEDTYSDWEESNDVQVTCPFSGAKFTSNAECLDHVKLNYSFDFLEQQQKLGLDIYGMIRLVNYIRSEVHRANKDQ
jgi:type I protein arginine methyltransferase